MVYIHRDTDTCIETLSRLSSTSSCTRSMPWRRARTLRLSVAMCSGISVERREFSSLFFWEINNSVSAITSVISRWSSNFQKLMSFRRSANFFVFSAWIYTWKYNPQKFIPPIRNHEKWNTMLAVQSFLLTIFFVYSSLLLHMPL